MSRKKAKVENSQARLYVLIFLKVGNTYLSSNSKNVGSFYYIGEGNGYIDSLS